MNITLSYNPVDNIPNTIQSVKLRFSLRYRYAFIWSVCVGIASIILLVVGFIGDTGLGGIGLALLYLSLFYFIGIFRARKKSIQIASDIFAIENNIGQINMSFTDALFIYTDKSRRYEMKWMLFSGYFVRDGFLFLIPSNQDILTAYSIAIGLFEQIEFDELNRFLFDHVPLYKYKPTK
jgi:hypothetical protein